MITAQKLIFLTFVVLFTPNAFSDELDAEVFEPNVIEKVKKLDVYADRYSFNQLVELGNRIYQLKVELNAPTKKVTEKDLLTFGDYHHPIAIGLFNTVLQGFLNLPKETRSGESYDHFISQIQKFMIHQPPQSPTQFMSDQSLIPCLKIYFEFFFKSDSQSSTARDFFDFEDQFPGKFSRFCQSISKSIGSRKNFQMGLDYMKEFMFSQIQISDAENASEICRRSEEPNEFKSLRKNLKNLDESLEIGRPWNVKIYGGAEAQKPYQDITKEAIATVAHEMKEKNWNFHQVLEFLAQKRNEIAVQTNTDSANQFGVYRIPNQADSEATTPMTRGGNYGYKFDRILELIQDGHSKVTYKGIDLTSYFSLMGNPNLAHTGANQLPKLMNEEISPLFEKIRLTTYPANKTKQLLKDIGSLHWLLAHAMPFRRGSAAISENLTRALLLYHGRNLPPYAPGIVPDLEALTTPDIVQFAKFYSKNVFKSEPAMKQLWVE